MNYNVLKIKLLPIIVLFFTHSLFGQSAYFNKYKPVECSGKLPVVFTKPLSQKIHDDSIRIEKITNEKIRKSTFDLFLETDLSQNELFSSSRILFGDTITKYINRVANNIIKYNPDLKIGLEFYGYKSSVVNAGAYCNNVIIVNTGLITYLNNEAELAYVLCHEISHVIKEHQIKSIAERFELEEEHKKNKKNQKSGQSAQVYIDEVFKKSAQQELQADSLGLIYFSKTKYDKSATTSLLATLKRSDFSYGNCKLSQNLFDISGCKIPSEYFLESVNPIKPIEEENDRYATHPNIKKRLDQVRNLSASVKLNGNLLFEAADKNEFEFIRDVARFERVRLLILAKSYGDAIYESYCLLNKYPDNEYLNISIAKAYYGLAKYKDADEFTMAARSYKEIEGESEQIHYLLKQLDRKQLNVYAYKQVKKCSDKYPSNTLLKLLYKDLIKDMVVENKLKKEDLVYTGEDDPKKFYKLLLKNDLKDTSFTNTLSLNYPLLEKKKHDDLIPLDLLKKEATEKDIKRKKDGPKLFVEKMIIFEPTVVYINKKNEFDLEETNDYYHNLVDIINSNSSTVGINTTILNNKYIVETGGANYNKRGRMTEWIEERLSHGEIEVLPLTADMLGSIGVKNSSKYVCYLKVYCNEKNKFSYCIIKLYDVETSKEELSYITVVDGGILKMKQLNKLISEYLQTAKK